MRIPQMRMDHTAGDSLENNRPISQYVYIMVFYFSDKKNNRKTYSILFWINHLRNVYKGEGWVLEKYICCTVPHKCGAARHISKNNEYTGCSLRYEIK